MTIVERGDKMSYKVGTLVVTPRDSGWLYSLVDKRGINAEIERLLEDASVKKISITKLETEE